VALGGDHAILSNQPTFFLPVSAVLEVRVHTELSR
jgi:hypothetical protein